MNRSPLYGRLLLLFGCLSFVIVYWLHHSSHDELKSVNHERDVNNKRDVVNNKRDVVNNKRDVGNNKQDVVNNKREMVNNKRDVVNNEQEVVIALTLCKGIQQVKVDQMKHSDRQLLQTGVLMKSAVALTSVYLRFIIVADSRELFDQVVALADDWPEKYRRKLTFQYVPGWIYPPNLIDMRDTFRPCSTQRIFLPAMLPEETALLYLDTDIIFMTPPEDVWAQFYQFNAQQIVAIPPILKSLPELSVPYFNLTGQSGLNTGVMLMNLTRMKAFPGDGWVQENIKIFEKFKKDIAYGDQDIVNQVFLKYPDLLFISNCEWDYQVDYCREGIRYCPEAIINGARMVHGNTAAFVLSHQWKMRALFESWRDYTLGTSLMDLYHTIKANLHKVTAERKQSQCSRIKGIDVVLSKRLLYHIIDANI